MNESCLSISAFAEKIGVTTRELIRWDKIGLLVADRSTSNRRRYNEEHISKYNYLLENHPDELTRIKRFPYKDLTNQRFGKLKVLNRSTDIIGGNGHRHITWTCLCECGNTVDIKGSSLRAGYNKSCGCSQYGDNPTKQMWREYFEIDSSTDVEKTTPKSNKKAGRKIEDLSNQSFGHLRPVRRFKRNNRLIYWVCLCTCGNETQVRSRDLKNGTIVSCGCVEAPLGQSLTKSSKQGLPLDLKGQSYGFWTVVEKAPTIVYKSGGRATCWNCSCICGSERVVRTQDLRSGSSQSCGCMTSQSWLEYYVEKYLISKNLEFTKQVRYEDLLGVGGKPLSFDFVIIKHDGRTVVVECQGEQHYRPIAKFGGVKKFKEQQIHDGLKKEYALNVLQADFKEILYTDMTEEQVFKRLDSFDLIP